MADNEQSANYETASQRLDETFNRGSTYLPAPVTIADEVPDPTKSDPAAPIPASNPEPETETSGA
ncbi:MAG TPA: hypothetical protein VGH57_25180 [Amycolatopsis sp.]